MPTLARRVLRCHPQSPSSAVEEVTSEIAIDTDGTLVVAYRIAGDLTRLRIPTAPLDPDRLWEHTCCELFIAPRDSDAYVEHNFSPNGQVARFDFSAYRQRVPSAPGAAARTSSTRERDVLALDARVPLPPDITTARITITAVVEDDTGNLSYWALHHPSARPDFHHPGGFALSLTLGAAPAIVDAAP